MGKYPCRGCKYFKECGNSNRTVPCDGRQPGYVNKTKELKQRLHDAVYKK